MLVFHISSRYFNFEPLLGRLAADAKPALTSRIWRDTSDVKQQTVALEGWYPSTWLVMARSPEDLGALAKTPHWTATQVDSGPAWTNDFSNIIGTMQWRSGGLRLTPQRWMTSGRVERAEAHAEIANYLLHVGRFEDAADQFERSLELDPDNAVVHYGLGFALAKSGKTEEAADEYAKSLLLDPSNALAHFGLGVAAGKLGDFEKAKVGFRNAIKVDPDYVEAYINLGNALVDHNEFQEAIKCYRGGIAIKPGNADLHYGLGQALMRYGQVKPEALDEFRKALPLAEQSGNAALAEKIMAAIRHCEAWPWDEQKK
jgi:Flp pilus assembly protein TadD